MKKRKLILSGMAFLLLMVTFTLAASRISFASAMNYKELNCDLTGDGTEQVVRLEESSEGVFLLKINNSELKLKTEKYSTIDNMKLKPLDINKNDNLKEIEVVEEINGWPSYTVINYDGSKVRKLFETPGYMEFNGKGEISVSLINQRLFTCTIVEKYKYNGKQFIHIPKKYFEVMQQTAMKKSIYLQKSSNDKTKVMTIKKGEKVKIVLTDGKGWFKLVNQKGKGGWFYCDTKFMIQGKSAYDVFTELIQAG